ncbi:MAG: YdcF family protein [Patescibacteria group bacterium]
MDETNELRMAPGRQLISALEKSNKPLIIPFPAAMFGSEFCFEQNARLKKALQLWYRIDFKSPQILCAGGLQDSKGISLAKNMKNILWRRIERLAFPHKVTVEMEKAIILGEEESTHTAEQIRFMKSFIEESNFDLLIIVSNWWHLRGILRLFRNCNYKMPVIGVASPTCGSAPHRLSRAIQETIRWFVILTIDKKGYFFDRFREKRKQDALKQSPAF